MDALLRQVRRTIQDFHMLHGGQTLLVAVSGGPDSVAMLHILYQLRECLGVELVVAHLNHAMRPGAGTDASFVEALARSLHLACISETIDVPAYQRRHKLSPEDAARRVRYAFLRGAAQQWGAERIAVGHTADDRAETVLLRLLRGAGLRGLAGMLPVREAIIRPLIRVPRADILAYLQARQLPFRSDPSNQDRRYMRNRLRLDLIPHMQQHYNPRLVQALCTTADLLAADEAALKALAHERLRAVWAAKAPDHVCLRITLLKRLPLALQRRVLREALRQASGTLQGLGAAHIAAIERLMQVESGSKRLTLPRDVVVERQYNLLCIRRQRPPDVVVVDEPLPVPGQCTLAAIGITVVSRLHGREILSHPFPTGDAAWLDANAVGCVLRVRTRRPGDRFRPLGSTHLQKLKSVFINAKVPRMVRDHWPLVVSPMGIAWVVGMRIADWAKVTSNTRDVLSLQAIRQTPESTAAIDP